MSSFNLFEALEHIDKNDHQYFSSLSKEEQKKVSTFILLKWMACTNSKDKALKLNASTNNRIFKLNKYPELIYHTLSSCGSGNKEFYSWIKKKGKEIKRPLTVEILKEYYNIGTNEALEDSKIVNEQSVIEMAEELGYYDKIKSIKREF